MNILVVNDDGIQASGIHYLAEAASKLGEVWVVAPNQECSAMSHRITVRGTIDVFKEDFSKTHSKIHAFSISGTPADCVKVGINEMMPVKPDIVFSGINYGYNVGFDILYSGTVGAAMEAILNGIPAIAFSKDMNDNFEVVDEHLVPIAKELMSRCIQKNEIWNVNFPACSLHEFKGIQDNCVPGQGQLYIDNYDREEIDDDNFRLTANGIANQDFKEGTDIRAVLDNYISIGKVVNNVLEHSYL